MVVASAIAATKVAAALHRTMPRGVSVAKRTWRSPPVRRCPFAAKPNPYAGTGGTKTR
jgi:hypothetical protein